MSTILEIQENTNNKALVVGIDLGTTNSIITYYNAKQQKVELIADELQRTILPSVVYYGKNEKIIGHVNPKNLKTTDIIRSAKTMLGKNIFDIANNTKINTYYFSSGINDLPLIRTSRGNISPVQVLADILIKLRQIAESQLKQQIYGAVITVPAYFDDNQRQATKDAAEIAGINVLQLLNEPTAAAVAYGMQHNSNKIIIYDLGGGTFDVSILQIHDDVFEVLATGGNSQLGGDDIDLALTIELLNRKKQKIALIDTAQLNKLVQEAKKVKEKLSIAKQIIWQEECFTQQDLAKLMQKLLATTAKCCKNTLKDANLTIADIDAVILVGGSTRSPIVQTFVTNLLQQTALNNINPEQVVAIGAAKHAYSLVHEQQHLLLDVIPLSLGIETMGGLIEVILERNTKLPIMKSQTFTTYVDGQTAMKIHVVQGERELVNDCRSLAKFELKNIPAMPANIAQITICFKVDINGILQVTAIEETSQITAEITVEPSYGLNKQQVQQAIQESYLHASEDINLRKLRHEQIQTTILVNAVKKSLQQDLDLLSDIEQKQIKTQINLTERAILSNNIEIIRKSYNVLNEITVEFANKRLSKYLRQNLIGLKVNEGNAEN
mgnify:CR=1 FL=1